MKCGLLKVHSKKGREGEREGGWTEQSKETHTHLYLYLYYHCQNWLHGPHLGGEPAEGIKTGGPVGSGDTSLISPIAWPPQCNRGTHLYGLARPMR